MTARKWAVGKAPLPIPKAQDDGNDESPRQDDTFPFPQDDDDNDSHTLFAKVASRKAQDSLKARDDGNDEFSAMLIHTSTYA